MNAKKNIMPGFPIPPELGLEVLIAAEFLGIWVQTLSKINKNIILYIILIVIYIYKFLINPPPHKDCPE